MSDTVSDISKSVQPVRIAHAKRPRAVVEGATRGRSVVIGLQTRPIARTMADGVCRPLKAISESPLISVNELEKFAAGGSSVIPERAKWRQLPSNTRVAPCMAAGATTSLPLHSAAFAPSAAARRLAGHRKPDRREPHAARHIRRLDAEVQAIGRRVHHLDLAARRLDRDAARGRLEIGHAGERLEKDVMVGRVLGDEHHAGNCRSRHLHAAGMPDSRSSPDSAAGR